MANLSSLIESFDTFDDTIWYKHSTIVVEDGKATFPSGMQRNLGTKDYYTLDSVSFEVDVPYGSWMGTAGVSSEDGSVRANFLADRLDPSSFSTPQETYDFFRPSVQIDGSFIPGPSFPYGDNPIKWFRIEKRGSEIWFSHSSSPSNWIDVWSYEVGATELSVELDFWGVSFSLLTVNSVPEAVHSLKLWFPDAI